MKQSKCYTCDKLTNNLLTANCGHKICFNCVKNNKNNHKCSFCSLSASKNKLTFSPAKTRLTDNDKQRTAKTKSIQTKRYDNHSPVLERSTRKSQFHIQSCSNYMEGSVSSQNKNEIKLLCKQHHEPLTLFSKISKQAICAICLCSKPKYKSQIMPITGAQEFIKKQNQLQREQSAIILNQIQKCHRLVRVNHEQFELYYGSHIRIINQLFNHLKKQLQQKQKQIKAMVDNFFMKKLKQCKEIHQDLSYLIETLQTYRQQNKESSTLTESLYVYSSFKVIKKTMKTLNLDYISYANKNVNLLEFNKYPFDSALLALVKFSEDLPLKHEEMIANSKKRNRSVSATQKSNQKESSYGYSNRKKTSLYENALNDRVNFSQKYNDAPKQINRNIGSHRKQSISSYVNLYNQSVSHNNSLSTYIHHNVEKQKPIKHNNSASTYFNQSTSRLYRNQPQIISEANTFDYELKTPIKNLLKNDQNSGKKTEQNTKKNENSHSIERLLQKNVKKKDFNVVSHSSITSGFSMNEEEKSLYKRLLKSRFMKSVSKQRQTEKAKFQHEVQEAEVIKTQAHQNQKQQ